MVVPRAVRVVFYMVAVLTWAAVVAAVAAATTEPNVSVQAIETATNTIVNNNNNDENRHDKRKPKPTVDQQLQHARRFRHEASSIRVLYQTGVSIFCCYTFRLSLYCYHLSSLSFLGGHRHTFFSQLLSILSTTGVYMRECECLQT